MNTAATRRHGSREKTLTVFLLNKSKLVIPIENKTRYGDILIKLRKHLKLSSSNVFGLAHKSEHGDFHFIDPLSKVWKTEKSQSQFGESGVTPHVYLRVQYYVESGHQFRSDADRQYYFLQLKENFLRYGFNQPDDRCFLLASYAIHSDSVSWKSFDPREYFPAWVLKRYGTLFVRKHMPTIRPDRISPVQAMTTYISELSSPIPYVYNMRLYRVQSCKHKPTNNVRVGVSPEGLEVYEVDGSGYLNFLNSYHWEAIQEIYAMKKKLSVLVNGRRLEFYTYSDEWCRELCETIQSARLVYSGAQATLSLPQELIDLDGTAFRESYIYSNEQDLELECEKSLQGTLPSSYRSKSTTAAPTSPISPPLSTSTSHSDMVMSPSSHCRFSIISNTSSTTTSGIVSDRTCLSTDASHEDLISSATRPSSCDSLLDSTDELHTYYPSTRLVTVQRAISEPSKKFEQLKFHISQHHHQSSKKKCLPRRALSDETIDEHDYENVAIIRQVLGMKPPHSHKKKPTQLSVSRSSDKLSTSVGSMNSNSSQIQGYNRSSSRKFSIGSSHNSTTSSPVSNHRYSLVSQSPSMEQLLLDYTPPPSYSEAHARQGQLILSTSRQVSQDSNCSSLSNVQHSTPIQAGTRGSTPSQQRREIYKQRRESQQKKQYHSQDALDEQRRPQTSATATNNNNAVCCKCRELSHPEIDRLRNEVERDLISLPPMIAALCKDKQLIQSTHQCTCNKPPISPRPISWHCGETQQPVFSFPNSNKLDTAQACH